MKKKKITDKQMLNYLLSYDYAHVVMLSFDGGDSYFVIRSRDELMAAIREERKK